MAINKAWWNLDPRDPERERLKRLAFTPAPLPKFIRGSERLRQVGNSFVGLQRVKFTNEVSKQFARLVANQPYRVPEGMTFERDGDGLVLLAGGKRFYLLSNATPVQTAQALYACACAIFEKEFGND